jgi:hypothetical protein
LKNFIQKASQKSKNKNIESFDLIDFRLDDINVSLDRNLFGGRNDENDQNYDEDENDVTDDD